MRPVPKLLVSPSIVEESTADTEEISEGSSDKEDKSHAEGLSEDEEKMLDLLMKKSTKKTTTKRSKKKGT
jgi:hypothetical protein